MHGAAEIAQTGVSIVTPLIVALLCLYARHRHIGGDYLLLWAAGHLSLALTFVFVSLAPAEAPLSPLPPALLLGHGTQHLSVWLLFAGVVAIDDTRLGFRAGFVAATAASLVFTLLGSLGPGLLVQVSLPAAALGILSAGVVLLLRRRSAAYVVAGLVLVARSSNTVLYAFAVRESGTLDPPAFTSALSIFFNFLTGVSLLVIAVENAWERLRTALREAHDARQEADTVLDLAPVSIVRKDRHLRFVKVNRYFEDMARRFGANRPPPGNDLDEILPEQAVVQMQELDRQILADPGAAPLEREIAFGLEDGSNMTMLVRKAAILDDAGETAGVISVALDITRLKEIESELREQIAIAEKASRAKSDFLAHMSHELRTPLNGINGYAEMLSAEYFGPLNAKQKEYVGGIIGSGKAMLTLVSRILDLSELDSGRTILHRSSFDLGMAAREAVEALADFAASRQVSLELAAVGAAVIDADREAVGQIFSNLLSNAIKFSPAGSRVQVGIRRDGTGAVVEIRDEGIGMSPEQIAALGDLFLRGNPLKARAGGGSGLGLAISRGLVELHGGTLGIASGSAGGTVVTIRL